MLPLCSVLYRRIALGSHVSLALALDVQQPGLMPLDCRFMGSEAAVAPLRCGRMAGWEDGKAAARANKLWVG